MSLTRVVGPYIRTPFNLIDLRISVKISAERYFKIPHYSSESGPLLSVFLFFIVFLISIFYFLINVNFVYKNLYLIKILFLHILLFSLLFLNFYFDHIK